MQIRLHKASDRTAWDDYVSRHPKGTFFHLAGWKEVVEKSFGHMTSAKQGFRGHGKSSSYHVQGHSRHLRFR